MSDYKKEIKEKLEEIKTILKVEGYAQADVSVFAEKGGMPDLELSSGYDWSPSESWDSSEC